MASGAWPEAFEMPGKATWRLQNATNHWGGLPVPNFQTPSEVKSYIRPWACGVVPTIFGLFYRFSLFSGKCAFFKNTCFSDIDDWFSIVTALGVLTSDTFDRVS